jgi:hypothetical protein
MKTKHIAASAILAGAIIAGRAEPSKTDATTTSRKVRVEYVTNYVNVPIVCATLEVADFVLEPGRTYKLFVADGTRPWRSWGILRSRTNANARVWLPAASTRTLLWQLVDTTPGFPSVAVPKLQPDCVSKPQFVVLGPGSIRPVQ